MHLVKSPSPCNMICHMVRGLVLPGAKDEEGGTASSSSSLLADLEEEQQQRDTKTDLVM